MPYDNYPAVDATNNFPPAVRAAIAAAAELSATFAAKSVETTKADLTTMNTALATKLRLWQPSTTYLFGDVVTAPNGDLLKAKVNHVSGTTFSATNWGYVITGDTIVRTNYAKNPNFELDAAFWTAENGATFIRDTTTPISGTASGKLTGPAGDIYMTTTAGVGEAWVVSLDYKTLGTVTGTPRFFISDGGSNTITTNLPLTQTTAGRFSAVLPSTGAGTTLVTVAVYAPATSSIWIDNVVLEKAAVAGPSFHGGTTSDSAFTYAWTGTANASTSTATATSTAYATNTALALKAPLASPAFTGTPTGITKTHVGLANVDNTSDVNKPVSTAQAALFIPKWAASTVYAANQQVVSPRNEVVKSKTARTSGATFDSTEAANWNGFERIAAFTNGGFAWSANANWDAGVLSVDASTGASSQQGATTSFVAAGSLSGSLKFTEPGIYDVTWNNAPSGEPGNAGYKIVASGTWPGPIDAGNGNFAMACHINGQTYWETVVTATGIRVPQANLEIRLVGIQVNASTNISRVKIVQRASI